MIRIFLLILHPLFSWAVLAFLGIDALIGKQFLVILVVALLLGGLSQNFWTRQLKCKSVRYPGAEVVSFGLGITAAVVYPILAIVFIVKN